MNKSIEGTADDEEEGVSPDTAIRSGLELLKVFCLKTACLFCSHFFFNWRKIALLFCVGFCHTTVQISLKYILFCFNKVLLMGIV